MATDTFSLSDWLKGGLYYLFINWLPGPYYTFINSAGSQCRNILPAAFSEVNAEKAKGNYSCTERPAQLIRALLPFS